MGYYNCNKKSAIALNKGAVTIIYPGTISVPVVAVELVVAAELELEAEPLEH